MKINSLGLAIFCLTLVTGIAIGIFIEHNLVSDDHHRAPEPIVGDGIFHDENVRVIETATGTIFARTFPNDLDVREYGLMTGLVTYGHDPPVIFHPEQISNLERKDILRILRSLRKTTHEAPELAYDLVSIDGVVQVTLDYNNVTIEKATDYKWEDIESLALSLLTAFEDKSPS